MARSDYEVMLHCAGSDLKAIQNMPDRFVFDEIVFGFHAQQACEKSLKAWLHLVGVAPPFIHDLRALIVMLADSGAAVPEAEAVAKLTKYAVKQRYGDLPPSKLLDRPATVALCERLYAKVAGLPAEGGGQLP